MSELPRVVIVGGGFGGLEAAKALTQGRVQVTVIDRSNHHIFQPLLYQVATAGLSPADISMPIRSILRRRRHCEVLMAEVRGIDSHARIVRHTRGSVSYDYLVIATGAGHSYFGRDEWGAFAPGLKTIEDAVEIRRRILIAFEHAEMEGDPKLRAGWLTFVVVGGGPTGVELAGSIAELSRRTLVRDFARIDPSSARVVLLEAGPRLLTSFPEGLSARARRDLGKLGVDVLTDSRVVGLDCLGVDIHDRERVETRTVLWAAGVQAGRTFEGLTAETDRSGRIKVEENLTVPGTPQVFVIGDGCFAPDERGAPLPGVAPVAMQQGRYVARVIEARLAGRTEPPPFRYVDKGSMATIGRSKAVFVRGRIQVGGRLAWMAWLLLHIVYLIGFRNRILVLTQWAWAYWTWERGARLITPVERAGDGDDAEDST